MTVRIAATILAIFAAGELIAPETPAQGRAFNGGRTAPFHSLFRAPTIRPIAPSRPAVALPRTHGAPFGELRHRRTPAVVWGTAPWYNAYDASWDSGSDAPWDSGFDAPPWYGGSNAPWYAGAGTLWYSGPGIPWYGGFENSTYAVPSQQNPSDTTNRNAMPPRLACRTQTYQVRSAEDGGERAVSIVRC
jgi:hypothetical protein